MCDYSTKERVVILGHDINNSEYSLNHFNHNVMTISSKNHKHAHAQAQTCMHTRSHAPTHIHTEGEQKSEIWCCVCIHGGHLTNSLIL